MIDDGSRIARPREAARIVGLSTSTLAKRRLRGEPPEYVKLGRAVGYRLAALDAWLQASRRSSTSQNPPTLH